MALQITVVALMPTHLRGVTAGLLAMATIMALVVVTVEVSFKRAAVRAAEAATLAAPAANLPRRPRERVSPLLQWAYHLARNDASASLIAGSCDIPEAFAELIIADVRRTASGRSRAGRSLSGRPRRRP